jgi:hypothetical protein
MLLRDEGVAVCSINLVLRDEGVAVCSINLVLRDESVAVCLINLVLRDEGVDVRHPAGGSRGITLPPNTFLCSSCTRPFQSRQPGGPSLPPLQVSPSPSALQVSPPFQQWCGSMKFWYVSGCGFGSADLYL